MHAHDDNAEPFTRFGPRIPTSPVIVSVPHAGRHYPPALLAMSYLSATILAALEDRFVDRLAEDLPGLGITGFIARHARAWVDLNRDERELDPAMVAVAARPGRLICSAKVRGGLGVIPRRIVGAGDIWRRRFVQAEIDARIAHAHRPWHGAIAEALGAARNRFGIALLIDLHSMPPLANFGDRPAARIVIGDRHGRSCAEFISARIGAVAAPSGLRVALNDPYAGGYTLERHGAPRRGIHAVQIEIDRSLYLAPDLRAPGPGMAMMTRLVGDIAGTMATMLTASGEGDAALAAE